MTESSIQPNHKKAYGLGEVLAISWPASLSMLNSTLMRFVDALMVSFIGAVPFSAQFLAGITAFVPESFATGVVTVVNTYVAQNLGARQYHRCSQYAWAGLRLALIFCVLIVPLALLARPIFTLLQQGPESGQPPELIELEIMYFRYMIIATFFTLTARPLEQFFYGIHRPRIVLAASVFANVMNIVGDYILIFGSQTIAGHLGKLGWNVTLPYWPAGGLQGAAIATMASWGMYFLILMVAFLSGPINRQYKTREMTQLRLQDMKDLFRVGWPAGVQFVNDVVPWVIMTAFISSLGFVNLTATSVAMRWMPLSFMPAVGIGMATTALVGRYLGAGQPRIAKRRAHVAVGVALVYMGLCGALFFVLREDMVRLFVTVLPEDPIQAQRALEHLDEIVRVGGLVMICAALFQLFDAIGITYIGALRGAGDTLWPMIAVMCTSWTIVVGGSWLTTTYLPQLGSIGPWIAGSLYVVVLGLLMVWRFESGAWQKIDLLHRHAAPDTGPDVLLPPESPSAPPGPPKTLD